VLGPNHPETLKTRAGHARWTGEAGDPGRARELFTALLPDVTRVPGPNHPETYRAQQEMIPLIPPDTTWDFFPTWFGNQPEGNPRVYMTFRDKRGKACQRDTHGRLTPFRWNVDNAPSADPVSGRIEPRLGTSEVSE
jgi:hypothetical protein